MLHSIDTVYVYFMFSQISMWMLAAIDIVKYVLYCLQYILYCNKYIVIELFDSQISLLVLQRLLELPEQSSTWSGETVDTEFASLRSILRNLSTLDLIRLAKMGEPRISVNVDPLSITNRLKVIEQMNQRDANLDYLLAHGGSNSMLMPLFRVSAQQLSQRRRELGVDATMARRPQLPAVSERERIQQTWYRLLGKNDNSKPTPKHYRSLHEQFPTYTVSALFAVVNEFDD